MEVTVDYDKLYKPHHRQAIAHAAGETYVLYGGAMGGGKTIWLVNEIIQLCLDYPGNRVFLCRWENASFKRTTYLALLKFLDPKLISSHNKSDQVIRLINGSMIMYGGLKPSGGSNPIDRIKSMDLGAFAIDEASEIPYDFFLVLCSRIKRGFLEEVTKRRDVLYKGLLTSNPEPGWIRTEFIDNKVDDHIFIPALPADNPHLRSDYVEDLRRQFPPEWIQKYLEGDWDAFEGDNYLYPYRLLRDSVDVGLQEDKENIAYGLDVAEYGKDATVLVRRCGPVLQICWEHKKADLMSTCGHILMEMDGNGDNMETPIKVDAIGVGAGVASRLEEMGYNVIRIGGAERPDEHPYQIKFNNKRTELYWKFKEKLEKGEVDLPDNDKLLAELSCIKYDVLSDTVSVWSKQKLRKDRVNSPNMADAVIYAYSDIGGEPMVRWI